MRDLILNTVDDLIADFLYYDRKEDSDLGVRTIDQAIIDGVISTDEIVSRFREKLEAGLSD